MNDLPTEEVKAEIVLGPLRARPARQTCTNEARTARHPHSLSAGIPGAGGSFGSIPGNAAAGGSRSLAFVVCLAVIRRRMNPLKRFFGKKNQTATAISPVEAVVEIVVDALLDNRTNTTMASSTIGTPPAADHGGPYVTMIVQYLLGTSYMTSEWQAMTMAIQGSMIVRNTLNKDGKTLQWFHALVLSILYGFAGGLLGFVWLGKPSSLLSAGDINLGACILAFVIVNYSPFDLGYKLLSTPPLTILYTSGAQLFRTTGIIRFVTACYNEFKHAPSPYYPIPVLGPILYGTVRCCCCGCGCCC
jgi:hypothetical protein